MGYAELETIHQRIEQALSYDLLGAEHSPSGGEEGNADSAINGHLSAPLNDSSVVESVRRYQVDPQIAGELYLEMGQTGMVCGYSFGQQTQTDAPQGAVGNSLQHALFVEVTLFRVVQGAQDLVHGKTGQLLDKRSDDVATALQSGRREAALFGDGIQTVTMTSITRLDGGGTPGGAIWSGRTHTFRITRNMRALQ